MKPSTLFLLMAEFGTVHIPITEVGKKYFSHDEKTAKNQAAANKYPFPVFRAAGGKSIWVVDIAILSEYLDKLRDKAVAEYRAAK